MKLSGYGSPFVADIKIFVREDGKAEVNRLLTTPLFAFPSASIEVISLSRENEDWGTADVLRHYANKITVRKGFLCSVEMI